MAGVLGRAGLSRAIAFEAVSLRRGGRAVFDRLTLTLSERRIGLIGDNGSGKSTLLRLANGLLLPDEGQVLVDGRDTARHRKDLPAEVGFVFQNPDHQILFPMVGEELAFGLLERGVGPAPARERVAALLAAHGCAGWQERAVHELSEGEKQLVCILAVIAPQPRVVLLDEPFSASTCRRASRSARGSTPCRSGSSWRRTTTTSWPGSTVSSGCATGATGGRPPGRGDRSLPGRCLRARPRPGRVRGMITAYLARRTWLHGVPAGAKLAVLAGLSLALRRSRTGASSRSCLPWSSRSTPPSAGRPCAACRGCGRCCRSSSWSRRSRA